MKHYEVESFKDLTLVEDGNDEGTHCGFALLEFSSRSDAKEAYKRLQKKDVVFGVDKPAEVSFADSFDDLEDDIMAQVYFWISFPCIGQGQIYRALEPAKHGFLISFKHLGIGPLVHIYVGFKPQSWFHLYGSLHFGCDIMG